MEPSASSPQVARFDIFEVDLRSGELCQPGSKIRLQDRPLQILSLLLEHPGEVVTREKLEKRLWPDGVVVDFDHSINTAVRRLRKALGDDAEHPRYIETLPRHGYRFIAPVEVVAATSSSSETVEAISHRHPLPHRGDVKSPLQKRVALATAGLLIIVAAVLFALNVAGLRDRLFRTTSPPPKIKSIAVLPLENFSADPEQEYFADGMTEELITNLGKVSALRVVSRTSVMRYKGTKKPLPEIARELNVDAIVEGTVRRSGDRVRITANLLHAPSDRHLWAQAYERDLRDVLSLQSEVARAIANQIRINVTLQERIRLVSASPVDPEAYRLYLQGRYYFFKRTLPAFEKSTQLLQRAVEKDSNSALAYAGLSESYGILPFYGGALPKESFPKAKEAALKALELDGSLAEAHAALAFVLLYWDWDWSAAESELKRAVELKPSYVVAHHWYSEYLSAMGRHEQAFAEIRRAQELDPVSPLLFAIGGAVSSRARRYDTAMEQARKALDLDPDYVLAHNVLAAAYVHKGMYEEAMAEFEERDRLSGIDPAWGRASVDVAAGRRGEAVKPIDRLWQRYRRGEVSALGLAGLYAGLSEKQRALDLLEKAYEQRNPNMVFLKVLGPEWDGLRSDPRFQDLLRRMNFPG